VLAAKLKPYQSDLLARSVTAASGVSAAIPATGANAVVDVSLKSVDTSVPDVCVEAYEMTELDPVDVVLISKRDPVHTTLAPVSLACRADATWFKLVTVAKDRAVTV
jgi:hypothetical protein